jgi:uncharacterized membrane protein HdeD (DUF308 family)
MYMAPGSPEQFPRQLTRDIAERIARNWSVLLVDGLALIVAGVLIFSIDWSVRSLSIFIGALFIFQGASTAFVRGFDSSSQRTNVITGLLSVGAGVAIIVWPSPGLTAVAIFLGSWLIVMGTVTIAGAFAGRDLIPDWWLWLILGLLQIPLGVLALANPGATLAALITVAGIWAVAVGITLVVQAFNLKRLPDLVDSAEEPDMQRNGRRDDRHAEDVKPDGRQSATSAR